MHHCLENLRDGENILKEVSARVLVNWILDLFCFWFQLYIEESDEN